jgi:hypothetical protein
MDKDVASIIDPVSGSPAPLVPFVDGVWLGTSPVSIVGMRLASTMTVLRLADGGLLVHSPVALSAERRAAVEALGPVRHLYAPNLFHHRWLADWAAAFPAARVHAPRGLAKKQPELRIDRVHGQPEPAFDGVIDEVSIDGFRLREGVLVHRPSRTLLVADLLHNVGRPTQRWAVFYTKLMGFYDRPALSAVIRKTGFDDEPQARRRLDAVLALPFERIVVGHGAPIASGGREALAAAYQWLR